MEVNCVWLGQGSFLFESGNTRLVVDPFLSDVVEQREGFKRLMDAPLTIEELKPDYILITHNHIDHFDPVALPEIHDFYPKVPILGPTSVMRLANEMGFNQEVLQALEVTEHLPLGDFNVTITPAFHSDPFSIGCLLNAASKTIYHTADTIFNHSLVAEVKRLSGKKIDSLLTCINGRLGNMNWEEAAQLAGQLGVEKAFPMHYGMFAENTEDPVKFINECNRLGIQSAELIPGKKTIL